MISSQNHTKKGFTLIEIMASLALFSVVVLVCTAALLALINVNKKAQAIQAVMNDLNVTIDGMVRNMREGSVYNCGGTTAAATDCSNGNSSLVSFAPYGASSTDATKRWVYQFVAPVGSSTGYIQRSKDGGTNYSRLTSTEVSISSITFYVVGTNSADNYQPRILIVIKGTAGNVYDAKTSTQFHIEASATQRQLDL